MFGSIPIATIRGIPIRVHFTMFVVFALLTAQFGLVGVPAGLLLFGSVLAHELGHSVVAQRFGVTIASIELHLFGGAAFMQTLPRRPRHELWIALAGPLVSLTLGLVAGAALALRGVPSSLAPGGALDPLAFFAAVNLGMAIFNLVPALPMDGGRVLRALLAERRGMLPATRAAARVSRGISTAFMIGGVWIGGWTLALMGALLFGMAGHEVRAAEAHAWREANAARLRAIERLLARTGAPRRRSVYDDGDGPVIDI